MSILKNIEKTFNEHEIRYFKGNDITGQIFNVPYCGIDNKNNHINIYIDIDEENESITFNFLEKVNKNAEIDTVRKKLLDLNSDLAFGILCMRSDSDKIEYKLDCKLKNKKINFDEYNLYIVRCIKIYEELQKMEIV